MEVSPIAGEPELVHAYDGWNETPAPGTPVSLERWEGDEIAFVYVPDNGSRYKTDGAPDRETPLSSACSSHVLAVAAPVKIVRASVRRVEHGSQPRLEREEQPDLDAPARRRQLPVRAGQLLEIRAPDDPVRGRGRRAAARVRSGRTSPAATARPARACRSSGASTISAGSRSSTARLRMYFSTVPRSFRSAGIRSAASTTPRSKSGERGSTACGRLSWSTFGRMWCPPLNVTFRAISRFTSEDQRGSHRYGLTIASSASGSENVRIEHPLELGEALPVRDEVAPLEVPAVEVAQNHRHVLRAAEAGVAALAVEHDRGSLGRRLEEERVRDGERLADRRAQRSHRRVEPLHHRPRQELDDVMVGAAVRGDGRRELELVRDPAPERERERRDGPPCSRLASATTTLESIPPDSVAATGPESGQAAGNRLLEPSAQPAPVDLLVLRLLVLGRECSRCARRGDRRRGRRGAARAEARTRPRRGSRGPGR